MEAHGAPGTGDGSSRATDCVADRADTFRLLSDGRRIRALVALRQDSPSTVEELAAGIVARERGIAGDEPSSDVVGQVALTLHHTHLPKLRDAGVVAFDPDDGTVALEDGADDVYALLDAVGVA